MLLLLLTSWRLLASWELLLLLLLLTPRTTWGLGDGDGVLDGIDGRVAGLVVDFGVDDEDDEPGVALPDSGAQRLSPYPLDVQIELELPTSNRSRLIPMLAVATEIAQFRCLPLS